MISMNPNVRQMEYAVRGPVVIRAEHLQRELDEGAVKNFDRIIWANMGDCQAIGQKPITFIRQVLSCVTDPSLIESSTHYPEDVKKRAEELIRSAGLSVGSYSASAGLLSVRKSVASFIEKRDNFPANHEDVLLTSGASQAVRLILEMINESQSSDLPTGVLIPIPQYPLYSATITEYGMHAIGYYLDEANDWLLEVRELNRALDEAKGKCIPKAIVVINPGNPVPTLLTQDQITDVIKFAKRENLVIIADEVFQMNVWSKEVKFHSFKKVLRSTGESNVMLASLMSASKGYACECGLRAGYAELVNWKPTDKALLQKLMSTRLCSSVLGQIAMDGIVRPSVIGDPSYTLYQVEKNAILGAFAESAENVCKELNKIPGITCNRIIASMYAFPRVEIPDQAIWHAKALGQDPDVFYCTELLEETGICVVPGSGFGKLLNSFHFRIMIYTDQVVRKLMMTGIRNFQETFIQRFSP